MVMYLLDTCILIPIFKRDCDIQKRVWDIGFDKVFVPEPVLAELLVGAYKSGIPDEMDHIRWVRRYFNVLPASQAVFDRYASLRADLEKQGLRLDSFDLLIAATALEYNLILVTGNVKHFSRIPDLRIENWIGQ